MDAGRSSETSVSTYEPTPCQNPEYCYTEDTTIAISF
jgi:hypothetical protein